MKLMINYLFGKMKIIHDVLYVEKKLSTFLLTKNQLQEGIELCIKKVNTIISDVEILCKNNGSESISVSLYTLAVEEFGKHLLLKKSFEAGPNKNQEYEIDSEIFIKHPLKFQTAISDLPEECLKFRTYDVFHEIEGIPKSFKKRAEKTRDVLTNFQKLHPEIEVGGKISITYDFDVRKNLFYVEWNDEKKEWESTLHTEPVIYEYEREPGFQYNEKYNGYVKQEGNSFTISSYPYREKEIELEEEEYFPGNLLKAIEFFRNHIGKV